MSAQPGLSNVSMANTKKELLEAYEVAKKRLQSMDKNLLDAEKAQKRLQKQLAEATADAQSDQDPVQRLHSLRGAISREMSDLAERFEAEIETYRQIKSAIEAKKEALTTIYEVETAASDLACLIDAQRAKKEEFEQEMKAKKADFELEMEASRERWRKEKADHDRQVQEQADALKKQRQREKEEYEYAFAREKAQRKNTLDDELLALEKEIASKRKEFDVQHGQRQAELDAREEAIISGEKEMAALQKEVETFPKLKESAIRAAVDDTAARLTSDFEKEKALMESKYEGEKNVLVGKIEALDNLVASQAAQIVDLLKKHEQAYEKVQDIANRAVAASKRETYHAFPAPGTQSPEIRKQES